MTKPEVTVIVPVYNTAKYLKRCLDSILSQTFNKFELICINDGSSDESLSILENYTYIDNRIKIISQNNKGLSITRNRGIFEASTNYLMFVDSDDSIESNGIEILYNKIKQEKSDLVIGRCKYINENKVIERISPKINTTLSKVELFQGILSNEISPSSCICIYKKELFITNNLYFPEGLYFEDLAFQYKVAYFSSSISIINEPFYNYFHLHNESISNNIKSKNIIDIFFIFQDTAFFLKQNNIENHKPFFYLRIYNTLKYLLLKISRNITEINCIIIILELLWKKTAEFHEFQYLSLEKKKHLVFLTLSILKEEKEYDFFTYFNLSKANIYILQQYLKSPLGLIQGTIECLKIDPKIKNIYIYGAGDLTKKILLILDNLNIKILGIIDKEEKKIEYKKKIFISKMLEKTFLKNNDTILITSISFAEDISTTLQKLSAKNNLYLRIINFERIIECQ